MENPKTSSHEGQNRNSQEVPIDDKFDTVGSLYSPFREEYDEQTGIRRFTENTLHDIIRDELLSRAVIWLLGYDARYPIDKQFNDKQLNEASIRAQAGGSHWETAWCVIHFLDARPILSNKHPSIVREIDRRLCSDDLRVNPLLWLLTEAINQGQEQVKWYGKEYDTAVVTLSLLKATTEYYHELSERLKADMNELLPKALRWLYAHLEHVIANIDVDEEVVTILEALLYANEHFEALLAEMWPDSYPVKRQELYDTLSEWLSNLEARLARRKEDTFTHFVLGMNEVDCLCRLISIWQDTNRCSQEHFRSFTEQAKILLLHYMESLEKSLAGDQWGMNLNRLFRLSTYMDASAMTRRPNQVRPASVNLNTASAEVVLKVLSMVKNEFFLNGSMYHSVYPTAYFLRALISVWKWPDAEKTITRLYHDLLDKHVIRLFLERRESFELSRLLVEREHDLTNEKGRYERDLANERERYSRLLEHHRWLRRGFIAVLALLALVFLVGWAMPLLHFGHINLGFEINTGSGEGFITLIVTCAGLAGSVGYVINRLWSRLEQ